MFRIFFVIFFLLSCPPVYAAPNALSDIQAAVLEEDFRTAADLAARMLDDGSAGEDKAEVTYYLGLSRLRLGDYARAQETFARLLETHLPGDIYDRAAIGLIDALYLQGQYESALREADRMIKKRKDSGVMSLMFLKAARANLKLARWKKAHEFLDRIIIEYPYSFEADAARALLKEEQYFTVQVGAFKDKGYAEKLVGDLIKSGEYAYVVEIKTADAETYYRVRVGHLTTLGEAQELESRLSGRGYPTLIYP